MMWEERYIKESSIAEWAVPAAIGISGVVSPAIGYAFTRLNEKLMSPRLHKFNPGGRINDDTIVCKHCGEEAAAHLENKANETNKAETGKEPLTGTYL